LVRHDRHAGPLELRSPLGLAGDEHRDGVDERGLRVEAGLRVVALRLLGADREVGHEDVGAGVAQDLRDIDRRGRRLFAGLAVDLAEALERRAAHDGHAELADLGELHRVVLAGPDRLAGVETDLLGVDVERGHELEVADVVAAEHHVHEAGHLVRRVGVLVVLEPLDEGVGAVADAGDRQADLAHGWVPPVVVTTGLGTAGTSCSCVMRVSSSSQPRSSVRVLMSRSFRERMYGSVVGVFEGRRRLASPVVRWARRRSKRPSRAMGARKRQNATCTWKARSSEGSALTRSSRRRVSPLSVMPYTLRLRFLVRRPDFGSLVAALRWGRRAARSPLMALAIGPTNPGRG